MSPWWSKSSSKEPKKKANGGGIFGSIQRKLKSPESKQVSSRKYCEIYSEKGSNSRASSPTTLAARSQSFADHSLAQPLPRPGKLSDTVLVESGKQASRSPRVARGSSPLVFFPLRPPNHSQNALGQADGEGELATDSCYSDSECDSYEVDPADSRRISPQASDHEAGIKTSTNSPSSRVTNGTQRRREQMKPVKASVNPQPGPPPQKRRPFGHQMAKLQIPQSGAFYSAPDSSKSSPSRSPMRAYGPDPTLTSGFCAGRPYADTGFPGSGQCSSPGSGHNSSHNSVGGDMTGQILWQPSRCSPEYSPAPSPKMTSAGPSAGPSSRTQSGSVTPLHPRAGGSNMDSPPVNWPDDAINGKQQSHRLPLPPVHMPNTGPGPGPYSPSYSTGTTPTVPRSPNRAELLGSNAPRWKKGRLLGSGSFGQVYLGFNSESGEMCAMKEVTLCSDDSKSKESAQQLGQEVTLLSRLRHPNIVQYYGSETVDDKLYIYLEYVSGGSIHKLLQEYGELGEIAIRSYTHQILSGLAYLHAQKTVHRDVKGANLLVDPNGRVKLADFGMAKHITAPSCALSFKGSPYWMAPELINHNSQGCNFAVDIWSLGCTVIEMATKKPPWSQYEGVAALFKVSNSKELPAIPAKLSDECKDFILRCLQRAPCQRPTATQLLEHPFVKNFGSSERLTSPNPAPITNGMRSLGIGHAPAPAPEGVLVLPARGQVPRNISSPVSHMGSPSPGPLLHSRQSPNGRLSPTPTTSPRAISGSSTPRTGASGGGALPLPYYPKPYTHEFTGLPSTSRSPTRSFGPPANGPHGPHYLDPKPDMFRAMPQGSSYFQEIVPSENDFLGNQKETYGGKSVLADRVSQQLLSNHVKPYPHVEFKSTSPVMSRREWS